MNQSEAFETCIDVGGLVLFGADTVYGLACDPEDRFAVERLYLLKRRRTDKPSAIMFFSLEAALAALPELGERTREGMRRLMPGGKGSGWRGGVGTAKRADALAPSRPVPTHR